ncbi:MAG: tRNA (adenosine(37)-N6)-threonylcarbamoyltransferase complex dimerization subunit type 1 TsaB [Bifidobacteriaceae bacterium]|nr:tRNA (adenosine(37)-N6)-threonylcarbamoyltransferase complex dimerization subunit type 1 TsaB [Bifidobacteriaceae bacterium]
MSDDAIARNDVANAGANIAGMPNDVPTLVIDTSFGATVAVVGHEPHYEPDSRSHVEKLEPAISQVVAEAGLKPAGIRRIVVGTGPAPFTGLRAGIVAARAMAYATGAELLGQNVLEPQAAWLAANQQPDGRRHVTLAVNDARRKQLYYALYEMVPGEATPRVLLSMDIASAGTIAHKVNEWLDRRDAPEGGEIVVDVCGTGAKRYFSSFQGIVALGDLHDESCLYAAGEQGPRIFAQLAVAHHAVGDPCSSEPLYLRRPDVTDPAPLKHVTDEPNHEAHMERNAQVHAEALGQAAAQTAAQSVAPTRAHQNAQAAASQDAQSTQRR